MPRFTLTQEERDRLAELGGLIERAEAEADQAAHAATEHRHLQTIVGGWPAERREQWAQEEGLLQGAARALREAVDLLKAEKAALDRIPRYGREGAA